MYSSRPYFPTEWGGIYLRPSLRYPVAPTYHSDRGLTSFKSQGRLEMKGARETIVGGTLYVFRSEGVGWVVAVDVLYRLISKVRLRDMGGFGQKVGDGLLDHVI